MSQPPSVDDNAILQQIFHDSPLPLAVYDADGSPRRANDAHRAFAEALGDTAGIGEFNAMDDLRSRREGHREHFKRATEGEVIDYPFHVSDGPAAPPEEWLYFSRLLMPLRGPAGQVSSVLSVIVDESDARRAELERRRMQEQLLNAQKLESLGLLAGGIAHDFNNLLVGVLGNASLLLDKLPEDSPLYAHVEAIETAARRAGDVAGQMLAFAGKGTFRLEEVDLSELVRETAELLRITVSNRAKLHHELAQALPVVEVDATQFRQIVMNLITNASEAMADQTGHITVRTGLLERTDEAMQHCYGDPDPRAQQFAFFEVTDTGAGMDEETLSKIFDPFFTTKFTGRGLGLSAVLGIVTRHRGGMSVRSEPGEGTTMRVFLPISESATRARILGVAQDPVATVNSDGHLLVVDDEDPVREILTTMLEAMGFSVLAAASGQEALTMLDAEADQVRLMLLDLTMPDQDGATTYRRVRERFPDVNIVFMSGYEAESVPDAVTFLHKPFTMAQLRRAVSESLG